MNIWTQCTSVFAVAPPTLWGGTFTCRSHKMHELDFGSNINSNHVMSNAPAKNKFPDHHVIYSVCDRVTSKGRAGSLLRQNRYHICVLVKEWPFFRIELRR
eukprot:3847343-Amphidinium_carterae.1